MCKTKEFSYYLSFESCRFDSAEWSKADRKQMSQQRLSRRAGLLNDGATASCVSFRFVRQEIAGASCPLALWEKPYWEPGTPPTHTHTPAYAITHPHITSLKTPPPCTCVFTRAVHVRRNWVNWWSEADAQRHRWSESANIGSVCVCERE